MKKLLFFLFLCLAANLSGQDSLAAVTKNFHFSDGVYLSFQEFKTNLPAYAWEEVEVRFFTNPQNFLTQVEAIFLKESGQALELRQVWGLSIGGIPYVQLPKHEIRRELPAFAALRLRGKICHFAYPDWRVKKVQVAAYNPLTGRPFRKGIVEREEEVLVEKMLHFETGEFADFTAENLLRWIQDDPPLTETLRSLPPGDQQEKLFKCLLIYVDRNPVFLRKK